MNNPNTDIRNYFKTVLTYPTFDSRQQTQNDNLCVLLLDQDNQREDETKCNIGIIQNFTIEAIERVPRFGNKGNRGTLDDITNDIYNAFDSLDITGYYFSEKRIADQSVITYDRNEILNRNILTLTFKIQDNGTN